MKNTGLKKSKEEFYNCCGFKASGLGTGIILLIIGLLWALRDIGIIPNKVSMWAMVFIVLGIWWIIKKP